MDEKKHITDEEIMSLLEHFRPYYPNLKDVTLEDIKSDMAKLSEVSSNEQAEREAE